MMENNDLSKFKVGKEDWEHVQTKEKLCWAGISDKLNSKDYLKKKSIYWRMVLAKLNIPYDLSGKRVLDLGAGPSGVLMSIAKAERKVALDPLINDYKEISKCYDSSVEFCYGTGETMVFKNEFDYIFVFNCLDHCQDMNMVIKNMQRALCKTGKVVISFNCHKSEKLARFISFHYKELDPEHPHQFLLSDYVNLVATYFRVLKVVNLTKEVNWINENTGSIRKNRFINELKSLLRNRVSPKGLMTVLSVLGFPPHRFYCSYTIESYLGCYAIIAEKS